MPDDKRTRLKVHPVKGIEFDAPTSRAMTHYAGISLLILAASVPLYLILWR